VPPVQDGAICSSPSRTSRSAPRRPSSPTGSASGAAEAEVEARRGLDEEHAYPSHGGHSLRDAVTTQEAPRPTINDSGDESIGGLPRCDGSRGIWTAPIRDASSSDLLSTITSTTGNDITGNTREPIAEPCALECLPSRKQSVQEPRPPAITLDDSQCTVERLLGRQVVSRRKGRRKRMVPQYWVKWQGWSDEYNEWVDENDIHKDLIAAYNSATA